jgi:predicted nucleic acid-binding protein
MTVLELYIGVRKVANTQEERRKVEAVLGSYPLVDMIPRISRRAGRLLGERMAETVDDEGPGIGKGNAVIAATALSFSAQLQPSMETNRPHPVGCMFSSSISSCGASATTSL